MEDSLYEVTSMRHFAGLALNDDRIVDESTLLQFRHSCLRQAGAGASSSEAGVV